MSRTRQHVDAIARRTGVPVVDAAKVIKGHIEEVTAALADDERVVLTGFGTFRMISGKPTFVPSEALLSALPPQK